MKPNEFDELVRQKFDQNDFEYNPRNWDRLEEQLDGRAKKRSIIMWWWVPLAGVAASVALAVGLPAVWQQANTGDAGAGLVHNSKPVQSAPQQDQAPVAAQATRGTVALYTHAAKHQKNTTAKSHRIAENQIGITLHDAPKQVTPAAPPFNFMAPAGALKAKENIKKAVADAPGYNTFKPEDEVTRPVRTSVLISGGISRGNLSSGYTAGATVRRMLNDKVYVEGEVAFANSDNTQATENLVPVVGAASRGGTHGAAAKSSDESGKATAVAPPATTWQPGNASYNASYAQVTPSVGYKFMKRMSVAVGPDFQQMLTDNRPVVSSEYRGVIQEAPAFDVGFIGKSEYAITKNVKAAVYYRKGVSSVISLNDKYTDRDYLQFQVKCAIFNK